MLTRYPSIENPATSVKLGADAYLFKPVNPKELLKVVEEKLREQSEAETLTEDKIAEWIGTRPRKLKQRDSSTGEQL